MSLPRLDFSCISFPGRIKEESEGKNDWKVPLSLCPFIDIPDQVTLNACSGILVAAAALVKSHAKRKASLAAAAFVLFFFGAVAASSCVSSTAAAGNINASEGLSALVGLLDVNGNYFLQVFLGRPLAQVGIYFVLIRVNWKEVTSECWQCDPGGCSCACQVPREEEGFLGCSCVRFVLLWCGCCKQLCFKYSSGGQH